MNETTALFVLLALFFYMGLMLGHTMSEHNPPNEPKPNRWSDKLRDEYRKGFNAGMKATLNQMRVEIKRSDERDRYGY